MCLICVISLFDVLLKLVDLLLIKMERKISKILFNFNSIQEEKNQLAGNLNKLLEQLNAKIQKTDTMPPKDLQYIISYQLSLLQKINELNFGLENFEMEHQLILDSDLPASPSSYTSPPIYTTETVTTNTRQPESDIDITGFFTEHIFSSNTSSTLFPHAISSNSNTRSPPDPDPDTSNISTLKDSFKNFNEKTTTDLHHQKPTENYFVDVGQVEFEDVADPCVKEEITFTDCSVNDKIDVANCTVKEEMEDASSESDTILQMEEVAIVPCPSNLPEKSKKRYEVTFRAFKDWCCAKNRESITEKVMLSYFMEKSDLLHSPGSLWCLYSMLKSTLYLNDKIDISRYEKLKDFVKNKNVGYRPKKSLIFTRNQLVKFLAEAPDDIWLLKKVAAIMGIAGACRNEELCRITVDNIQDKDSLILIRIEDSENRLLRNFTIVNNGQDTFHWMDLVRKYASLRPKHADHNRFFLKYQNGKCFNQVVGKNTFGKIPSEIATFLKLANPKEFTGHSLRKTSGKLRANTGMSILD